ncbi:P-selectin-like [Acanthopagrus latus]|uniref:P-selectin-like n=1 Tax=Acanthopagrus latus TaxID=8177 RepID=UPI00187C8F1D|nr:P-selectin-like [Acanthopagrus latus]
MMRNICILVPLLLLLPPVKLTDLRALTFIYYNIEKSWADAQAFCRENHTDLITIRNATENLASIHGWLGLYRDDSTSEWKWSRGDERANFTTWRDDDPDDGENCAFKSKSEEKWRSKTCGEQRTFMCYNEKLVLVRTRKTWEGALRHCRGLKAVDPSKPADAFRNHQYDLATLISEDDHVFAREKAQETDNDSVWTGLRFLAGQWMWVGGEAVLYENMRRCPKDHCGTLVKNSTKPFATRDCAERRSFLCYKKP